MGSPPSPEGTQVWLMPPRAGQVPSCEHGARQTPRSSVGDERVQISSGLRWVQLSVETQIEPRYASGVWHTPRAVGLPEFLMHKKLPCCPSNLRQSASVSQSTVQT